uniref:ubiquitinyl hydrolase 1 n=1 Tax=Seriola lalandi dorsalis TaxID=1841481 RepID=A0A3B4YQ89_SERLL
FHQLAAAASRAAEKLMDEYLKSLGLHRKKIAKDGSCLFRAVAEQVLHCQSLHTKVRAKCVEFLKQNRETYEAFIEGDFEDYLCKLQDPQVNPRHCVQSVTSHFVSDSLRFLLSLIDKITLHQCDGTCSCFLTRDASGNVFSNSRSAPLCVSAAAILYEVLYDGVFKVDRNSLGACQRLPRSNDLLSDDSMAFCNSSDESDLDANEWQLLTPPRRTSLYFSRLGRGRGRLLPERVRRSLNPTLFRNIEYDVWHKSKRAQQKIDYCIAAGMQYTAGDRCQVRLEGRHYNATIKEVPPNSNKVVVYIEELGNRLVTHTHTHTHTH